LRLEESHYSRLDVQREIVDFCRGRWVAAHYLDGEGGLVFRRYRRGRPLRIDDPRDLSEIIIYEGRVLRSIYASSNVYFKIRNIEDVYTLTNISRCSPVWDVDGDIKRWKATLEVAETIGAFLDDMGVERSLYFKWSGNGCHIHIHEEAFSDDLLRRHHPLDLAYAVVEYVNSKTYRKIMDAAVRDRVKVENKVDPTRVFTSPLSLHRELDIACVCFKMDSLPDFSLEWTSPSGFRHDPSWREYERGEADHLAEDAIRAVGGYPIRLRRRRRRTVPLDEQIMKWLRRE